MTLRRLTSLEAGKLQDEAGRLAEQIRDLQALLADPKAVLKLVADEATEMASKHGDARRTAVGPCCMWQHLGKACSNVLSTLF